MESDLVEHFRLVEQALHRNTEHSFAIGTHPSLSLALCRLQGITSCSGTIEELKPLWGKEQNAYDITVNGKNAGTIWRPKVEVLLQEAKPAPFGKGEETVYDENVRKGLQIAASELKISGLENIIPSEIHGLAPNDYELSAQLYKMHIYLPGGHFNFHRDTPHAANHLATLVIALPCCFQGGHLTLVDYKAVKSFPLGSIPIPDAPAEVETDVLEIPQKVAEKENKRPKCHWVTFYTDVQHKVEPVVSGTRVVLQFDLFATKLDFEQKNKGSLVAVPEEGYRYDSLYYYKGYSEKYFWLSHQREIGETTAAALSDLISALKKELNENSKQRFALVLKHQYTMLGLKPELLKNIDQLLWKRLAEKFEISLMPVLVEDFGSYESSDECYFSVKPFDHEHITRGSLKRRKTSNKNSLPTWVIPGSRESEALIVNRFI